VVTDVCYVSKIGKVRKNNEDSMLVNNILLSGADMERVECSKTEGENLIYIVADGMGGHQKGEVASNTVLNVFKEHISQISRGHIEEVLKLARESLNKIAEADIRNFGLGTTVSGMSVTGGNAFIFNCGDSRVYRAKGELLERITRDDSLVQNLVDAGVITEEEMRTHPQKNIITSAIIGDLSSDLPDFSVREISIKKGERFLLCTDGVWESMSLSEMERCFSGKDLKGAIDDLVRKTIENGAKDNFSIIALASD
jgi:PPM family protein phosphatase